MLLTSVLDALKVNKKSMKEYIKEKKRNKMLRFLATKSPVVKKAKKSVDKTKKEKTLGSGFHYFMKSKKTECTSQVLTES
jgi:hypothetical protein